MKDYAPNLLKRELEPILEMLEEKSKTLSRENWQEMVDATLERIASVPEQYLTGNLKPSAQLQEMVTLIFRERLN